MRCAACIVEWSRADPGHPQTEIEGFRQCHIRDGAALVRYFAWLEEQLLADVKISEYDAATRLEEFRK